MHRVPVSQESKKHGCEKDIQKDPRHFYRRYHFLITDTVARGISQQSIPFSPRDVEGGATHRRALKKY